MSVRREIPEKDGIYFTTLTCARWLHLFEKGEWNLVSDVCEYAHNSAKFYATGQTGVRQKCNLTQRRKGRNVSLNYFYFAFLAT